MIQVPEGTAANSPALQRREERERMIQVPEGTAANSPALQRRVNKLREWRVPEGRLNCHAHPTRRKNSYVTDSDGSERSQFALRGKNELLTRKTYFLDGRFLSDVHD